MTDIRFLLDENVTNDVARGLRTRDIDVLTVPEAGLIGSSDEEILAFALSENRTIVTQDDDFLKMASVGSSHLGIVYYKS